MATDFDQDDDEREQRERGEVNASELTDELARKYDPERLLKLLSKKAGRGDPLEHSVRNKYERRFGVDLGHVRVYTGEFAEEFNKKRGAYAVTVGATGMILMGNSPDKSMGSRSGEALLAHELTHVAQQARHAGGGLHRKSTGGSAMPFAQEHEAEAEATEAQVMQGGRAPNGAEAKLAQQKAAEQLKEQIEKVKQRVIELFGETARVRQFRMGVVRRA